VATVAVVVAAVSAAERPRIARPPASGRCVPGVQAPDVLLGPGLAALAPQVAGVVRVTLAMVVTDPPAGRLVQMRHSDHLPSATISERTD
jgi:hypothetical protein